MATRSKPFVINRMPGFGPMALATFFMLYAPIFLLIIKPLCQKWPYVSMPLHLIWVI